MSNKKNSMMVMGPPPSEPKRSKLFYLIGTILFLLIGGFTLYYFTMNEERNGSTSTIAKKENKALASLPDVDMSEVPTPTSEEDVIEKQKNKFSSKPESTIISIQDKKDKPEQEKKGSHTETVQSLPDVVLPEAPESTSKEDDTETVQLDKIEIVSIQDIKLRKAGNDRILDVVVSMKNSNEKDLKMKDCYFEVSLRLENSKDITLGVARHEEVYLESMKTLADTKVNVLLPVNLDIDNLYKEIVSVKQALIDSESRATLRINGNFKLGIKTKQGWIYQKGLDIDFIYKPEIQEKVLTKILEAIISGTVENILHKINDAIGLCELNQIYKEDVQRFTQDYPDKEYVSLLKNRWNEKLERLKKEDHARFETTKQEIDRTEDIKDIQKIASRFREEVPCSDYSENINKYVELRIEAINRLITDYYELLASKISKAKDLCETKKVEEEIKRFNDKNQDSKYVSILKNEFDRKRKELKVEDAANFESVKQKIAQAEQIEAIRELATQFHKENQCSDFLGDINKFVELRIKDIKVRLRSYHKILSNDQIVKIKHFKYIKKRYLLPGYCGHSEIKHGYIVKTIKGDKVVIDNATDLMWHQSGSKWYLNFKEVEGWLKILNREGYAGYNDWRLPTVEEAASLLESEKNAKKGYYINPVFDETQTSIWTVDKRPSYLGREDGWGTWYVSFGILYSVPPFKIPPITQGGFVDFDYETDEDNTHFVRPVRSMER